MFCKPNSIHLSCGDTFFLDFEFLECLLLCIKLKFFCFFTPKCDSLRLNFTPKYDVFIPRLAFFRHSSSVKPFFLTEQNSAYSFASEIENRIRALVVF